MYKRQAVPIACDALNAQAVAVREYHYQTEQVMAVGKDKFLTGTQIRLAHFSRDVYKRQIYDFNGLVINNHTHKCTLYDQPLNLTPIEFSILWYLCSKRGNVVTSEELFEAVWQEKYLDNNNTVMAHVARLREKMHENARKPKFIKTVWGVGYTIE